jgi:hypothetical protein
MPARRAASEDLHNAGAEADQNACLPGAVIGSGQIED